MMPFQCQSQLETLVWNNVQGDDNVAVRGGPILSDTVFPLVGHDWMGFLSTPLCQYIEHGVGKSVIPYPNPNPVPVF